MEKLHVIGKPAPGVNARRKVTGAARYLEDIELPGMLHGKVLRSPLPHAVIEKIDVSAAERLPGVQAVVTAKDTPKIKFSFIQDLADKYPLCVDRVRFVGDEVAAVAALDEATAEEALRHIEVEYRELPVVADPLKALKPDAAPIHEGGNVAYSIAKEKGDLAAGFARADLILEETFVTSRQAHCAMENRGCIASWDRDDLITVWHQTQAPHTLKEELARALGIHGRQIRVITPEVGGGFGSRLVMDMIVPIAAILSRRTGHPVRIVKDRREEFTTSRTRYPYIISLKLGLKRDGAVTAIHASVTGDNGAYNDKGPSTLNFQAANVMISHDAHDPARRYDGRLVYTNTQPGTAFRGFGHIELKFAVETLLNRAAREIGLDPLELRRKNTLRAGELACIRKLEELRSRPGDGGSVKIRERAGDGLRRGVGVAISTETGGGVRYYSFNSTEAVVKLERDGSIIVISPATDTGTGTQTVMAQIAAEELGVSVERVRVVGHDTDVTPYDLGTWASRTTFVCGNAVLAAARDARRQLLAVAADLLESVPEELDAAEDRVFARVDPKRSVPFEAIVEEAYGKRGTLIVGKGQFYDARAPQCRLGVAYEEYFPVIASSIHEVGLNVDAETGEVRVADYTAVHDLGKVLNPLGASGQVEGGAFQGIGLALFEDLRYEEGLPRNPNYVDYRLPRFSDLPDFHVAFVEGDPSEGPYGAKGLGELPIGGGAPAIASAIEAATGARLKDLPLEPESIWRALSAAKNKR